MSDETELTLNQRLAVLRLSTRPASDGQQYAKDIVNSEGETVFTGTAHAVTEWLRWES